MSVQKSSQNNSIKVKPEKALYVALEGAPNISLQKAQKTEKKKKNVKKKM